MPTGSKRTFQTNDSEVSAGQPSAEEEPWAGFSCHRGFRAHQQKGANAGATPARGFLPISKQTLNPLTTSLRNSDFTSYFIPCSSSR